MKILRKRKIKKWLRLVDEMPEMFAENATLGEIRQLLRKQAQQDFILYGGAEEWVN